jgi:DNA polymerase-3 subunit beta
MIISKTAPSAGEVRDEININYTGKELSIGFNPHYLIDVLKNIDQEEVTMELTGAENPGVIRTPDNYIYVVLPMQLT